MPTGFDFLMKNAGIDVKKITEDFTALKNGVTQTLQAIDGRLKAIEESQARSEANLMTVLQLSQKILDNQERVWKLVEAERDRVQAEREPERAAEPEADQAEIIHQ